MAVNVTEPPLQKVVGPDGVMDTTGSGLTTTACEAAAVQLPVLAVTVYVSSALTVMDEVVAPLDQV